MKTRLLAITALTLAAAGTAHAANQLIDFEDLPTSSAAYSASYPPVGYRGYTWSGGTSSFSWVVSQASAGWYTGTQTHSGVNYGWANSATSLSLVAAGGGVFDLTSLWARIGFGGIDVTAHGYLNGTETYSRTFAATATYALVPFNFTGIDRFVIDSTANTSGIPNVLVDDITISAAVPEPASQALLAAGLGVVLLAAARRRG